MSMGKGTLWVMGISLAVNMLLLGGILGVLLTRPAAGPYHLNPPQGPRAEVGFRMDGRAFFRALPQTERRKAIRLLRANADRHQKIRAQLQTLRLQIMQELGKPQLDETRLTTLLQSESAAQAQEKQLGQEVFLQLIADLDPQTRTHVLRQAFHRDGRGNARDRRRRPRNPGNIDPGPPPR